MIKRWSGRLSVLLTGPGLPFQPWSVTPFGPESKDYDKGKDK